MPRHEQKKTFWEKSRIPADAYYGVQTLRALENFQVSGVTTSFYPDYVKAYAMVKLAAARANYDVGRLPKERLDAIEKACKGSDGRKIQRPVPGGSVPGWCRNISEHECQ
jgi:aspartate ammonia-lyase